MSRRLLRGALLAAGGLLLVAGSIYLGCPRPSLHGEIGWSRAYQDRDGGLLRLTLAPDQRYRLQVPLGDIAPEMRRAVLLYEDRHFYRHPGVNPAALLRAAWSTFISGGRRVGASTISMQLARIRFGLDTRSIGGKLVQIARALQLERHYSKAEILQAYLARVPYGRNIEGVGAASLIYFGKPAERLSLPEALALAVIPQNPTQRNPASATGQEAIAAARTRLFQAWLAESPEDAARAAQLDLPLAFGTPEQLPFRAPHLTERLQTELAPDAAGALRTTIDPQLQTLVEEQIDHYVERHTPLGIDNAVALLLDTRNMAVAAYVGSADFFNDAIHGQVDGVRARRSPGSALKPFVYALAMDQGLIHPMSLLKDAPHRFGAYTPENFDQDFLGPLFARDALVLSRNVPAVQLAGQLQQPDLHGLLAQAGVAGLMPPEHYGLALVLGAVEVSMEELAQLYALLANGGDWRQLRFQAGQATDAGRRLLSPEASFLTLDMLRGAGAPDERIFPGQLRAPLPAAWKTGTSYGFRDAWSVGLFGPYVLAVWVGRFDGSGNPVFVGRRAAGPLFFEIARAVARVRGPFPPPRPAPGLNLARVEICAPTGDLPNAHCPRRTTSWFIPGVSPLKVTSVYRAIPIDVRSGQRACFHEPPRTRLEVYEFWPSDLARLMRTAGIARRRPPPMEADCPLNVAAATGAPPEIRSPDRRITYSLQSVRRDAERIPFSAVSEADAGRLHWFVNDRYVGAVPAGETLFWQPAVGSFEVRVVDDRGRAAATPLTVRLIN